MAKRLGPRSPRSPMATAVAVAPENVAASKMFDQFCAANTFQAIMGTFHQMCDLLELRPNEHRPFYRLLKLRLTSWKAQSLWVKLDKRASHREYKKSNVAANTRVLIIGCGPCGLRTAIEIALMGGKVVVVEKRDRFSRNNVLHLWPYLIHDLKAFGAKKFFGKFCAGAIDHISIRTLQCILLKIALLVGVEVHGGVGFTNLADPENAESPETFGWRAKVDPPDHPVSEFEFDVLVGADGKRNTLSGFKRKEFRGKLAIAITANFINRNSQLEARVEEISGVAYIFNQKFFKDLNQQTGIDLENIVYYKDETHYFVMTAKKHSLLNKRVLRRDYDDPAKLLARENVDQEELMNYAKEAADVSTNHMLPHLDFAHNHYGLPDVAMFDFTSMFAAEHASRVIEKHGKKLLVSLVGDSLLEPFWPTGSGCARGFLSALDTGWMIKNWASGKMTPLEVMAERESVYQLLSQTTPENLSKNFSQYTIDPLTRYPNVNTKFFKPFQVRHQYDGVDQKYLDEIIELSEQKSKRYEWTRDSHYLQKWYQKQLEPYKYLFKIQDLTSSFRNGLALSALVHKYRPELLEISSLDANKVAENNQKVFDLAHKEFGILPVMSGEEMAACEVPDKLKMASYLSQFFEYFRKEIIRPAKMAKTPEGLCVPQTKVSRPKSPSSRLLFLNKVSQRFRQKRIKYVKTIPIWSSSSSEDLYKLDDDDMDKENDSLKRQRKPGNSYLARKKMKEEEDCNIFVENYKRLEHETTGGIRDPTRYDTVKQQIKEAQVSAAVGVRGQNKVSALAHDLARQFSGEADASKKQSKASRLIMGQAVPAEVCYFCKDKVYVVERHTAEGLFFHRGCLKCDYCSSGLRIGGYAFQRSETGEAKFYCFQHHGMTRRPTRARKRSFGDKDLVKKLLPVLSPDKPPSIQNVPPDEPSTPLNANRLRPPPIISPDNIDGDKNKTPERIEFEPESEYEESELEQTAHNLSSSLLDVEDEEVESDSDSEEDEGGWSGEELSDADRSWADLARSYSKQLKKRLKKEERRDYGDDSDSDTATIGASDADYETDTETEEYEDARTSLGLRRRNIPALKLSPPKDHNQSPQKDAKSPASEEVKQNRLSFFSAPSQPVRIDPWSFLGLGKSAPQKLGAKSNGADQDQREEEMKSEEKDSGDDIEDIEFDKDEVLAEDLSLSGSGEEGLLEANEVQALQAEYMRYLAEENQSSGTEDEMQALENEIVKDDEAENDGVQNDVEKSLKNNVCDTEQNLIVRNIPQRNEFDMSEEELERRREEKKQRMNRSDEVCMGVAGVKQLSVPVVCLDEGASSDATSLLDSDLVLPHLHKAPSDIRDQMDEDTACVVGLDSNTDVYTVNDLLKCGLIKETSVSKTQSEINLSPTGNTADKCTDQILASSFSSSHLPTTSSVQNVYSQSENQARSLRDQHQVSQNRLSFFDSPTQPVRIDAGSFLGLGPENSSSSGSNIEVNKQNEVTKETEDTGNLPADISGVLVHEGDAVNTVPEKDSVSAGRLTDATDTEFIHKDVKHLAECDNSISVVGNSDIAQSQDSSSSGRNASDVCDSLSDTQMMVLENLKDLNDTLTEDNDLSALVSDNINQLPTDDTLLMQNQERTDGVDSVKGTPDPVANGKDSPFVYVEEEKKNRTHSESEIVPNAEKSSSSESDNKFDTIKRKKKGGDKQVPNNTQSSAKVTQSKQESFSSNGTDPRRGSDDRPGLVMTSSFYSEGTTSNISHIADSAPLASLEMEMEMTSGTDTDFDQQTPCLARKVLVESDSIELESIGTDEVGTIPSEKPFVQQTIGRVETETSKSDHDDQGRRKSDIERDAIRRIDELLISYEQSKETKIDFPVNESSQQQCEKANTITKWLRDTINPSISPISKPTEDDFDLSDNKLADKTNDDSSSLPYVSFKSDPAASFENESYGTPNAAFIGNVSSVHDSLNIGDIPVRETDIGVPDDASKHHEMVGNDEIPVRETDILNDSIGSMEDELVKHPALDGKEKSNETMETNDSIVEFKVSDGEGDHAFQVDEKFVSVRDRKKKKPTKISYSNSSDFTISTPSGSVDSTSTATDLQSTQQSSLALTTSTTGDSFSAVKKSTLSLPLDEDQLSFSDIALAYQKDSSVSLEKLVTQNEEGVEVNASITRLSSQEKDEKTSLDESGIAMLSSRSEPMDIPASHYKSATVEPDTNTLKAEDDLVFSFEDPSNESIQAYSEHNTSIPILSTSAPTSGHPFQPSSKGCSFRHDTSIEDMTSNTPDQRKAISVSLTDDSFYYTPEVSGIEAMDTSENNTPKSPAPSTRTVKSDSTILDDRRIEMRRSDQLALSQSPTGALVDAKRRFFCETPQPVRIDHFKMFEKDKKMKSNSKSESKQLAKGWKSLDTPTTTSISPAVPKSNILIGDDKFFTPATSVKTKTVLSDNGVDSDGFKRPTNVSRKIIPEDAADRRMGKSVARELSTEEKKKLFDQEREKARQEARERARMLSDEELGVRPTYTPRKGSFKETNVPSALDDLAIKSSTSKPGSDKSYTTQLSKESSTSVALSDGGLGPSPSSGRKGKVMKVFQKSAHKSPKMDKKNRKKKTDDEEKENKAQDSNKKEKRKSLLQKLLPSKSVEKKDKSSTSKASVLPTTYNGERAATASPVVKHTDSDMKTKGVIFRSKKSKSLEREKKALSLEEGKRDTLYKELAPMFHQVLGGPDGNQSVSAVRAKIETVAPPPAKAPHTVLEPPKATEDFDTESEFGDNISLRSFQESNTVGALSEEELTKVMKKQQKAAKKRQREQELRRLHTAQEIQRQLEEVEVKQREIEQRGVIIERALRGEGPDAKRDESELMQEWFNIVHEKNVLVRYESELMVHARELELEDRHARLEQQLRDRMSIDEGPEHVVGGGSGREEERRILQELVAVVEQRDALVGLLEEDRQREREQEQGLKAIMSAKGFQLSPITYANRMRLPSLGDVHRDTR